MDPLLLDVVYAIYFLAGIVAGGFVGWVVVKGFINAT